MPEHRDLHRAHAARLERWRQAYPESGHHFHDLETLEELKSRNDLLVEQDLRELPDVCRSYPAMMTIGNTHACNIVCPMCFKQRDPVDNLTWPDFGLERFQALAHEVFPHVRRIRLSVSGEPFLSRTIYDELNLCATYGVRTTMTTNGTLLHRPGLLDTLMPALDSISISVDGASAPVFEHIRAGASFERVIQNVRLFNEARDALPDGAPRPLLHFVFALQHANVQELPRFLEMCHELQVDLVSVDHVIVHDGLNEADSLHRHRRLVKDVLEQAAEITERRQLNVDLPDPLAIDESVPDEPHDPLATIRAAAEAPPPPAKIHARDWPMPPNPLPEMVAKIRSGGGGNPDFLQHLEEIGHPFGPFEWGIHHLGDSLIPMDQHSRNRCMRPWDETYIDYDGAVAPCENANMGLARWTGVVGEELAFREIWNGPAYQNLRRSLRTGANFKYCHTCYIARPPDQADWKMSYS